MAKPWAKPFYDSARWKTARRNVLRRDCYSCALCGARATEVHHIIELSPSTINDWNIALNPENLQSLCWWCHNKVTKGVMDVVDGFVFGEDGQVVRG